VSEIAAGMRAIKARVRKTDLERAAGGRSSLRREGGTHKPYLRRLPLHGLLPPDGGLCPQRPPLGTPLARSALASCVRLAIAPHAAPSLAGSRSKKAGVLDLPDISKRGLAPRRTSSRMPEHPNGTPGKKLPAPPVKKRLVRSFSSLVEILKSRPARHADDAELSPRTPKKKRREAHKG
jgi:hypothetical protein